MTKPETTPSPTTGRTLTELFELGWLKVIPTGIPFQGDIKPHSLKWVKIEFICDPEDCCGDKHTREVWECTKCRYETDTLSDLRKGNCNLFRKIRS